MTTTSRQNNLILNEDWTRIYQTFQSSDFKSYDFENLRRVIIAYFRENYPEDFNDYIESSEYLALIDAIAFLETRKVKIDSIEDSAVRESEEVKEIFEAINEEITRLKESYANVSNEIKNFTTVSEGVGVNVNDEVEHLKKKQE
jgi:hypothetical protein